MNATSQIDSQLSNIDSCRSKSDIAAALFKANIKQIWQILSVLLLFIILCSLVGLILIIIADRTDNSNMILLGFILLAIGLVLGFAFLISYCLYKPSNMKNMELCVLELKDEQWSRYLAYFFAKKNQYIGCSRCRIVCKTRRKALEHRGFGHVVISRSGFMIDELYYATFAMYSVLNVDRLTTKDESNIEDSLIRLQIAPRLRYATFMGEIRKFNIDIFIPPNLPSDYITNIMTYLSSKGDIL
ncbi:unnamed protein product [Adineta ricciae]|uniref:Transmembrane protein n=1 Tax=Adineta ricciae TaxID=249248 RepID=A0A815TWS0_ADIRI|nr:unnamed protein product [Adineta ricciae]CAF1616703.1 unnamed protein product [Adineta ricciae]